MEHPQYPKNFITEALCEFRFDKSMWRFTLPGEFFGKVQSEYDGKQKEQPQFEVNFDGFDGNVRPSLKPSSSKFIFSDSKEINFIGVGPGTFSVHTLRQYDGWGVFVEKIKRNVDIFWGLMPQVDKLSSVVLKYINTIDIPLNENGSLDLNDCFGLSGFTAPQIEDFFDHHINIQFGGTVVGKSVMVNRSLVTLPNPQEGNALFKLEIDVIWTSEFEKKELDKVLLEIHDIAFQLFESVIGPNVKKLLKQTPV